MGHVLCIASLKGGVGKTTTAVNLSAALAALRKKTLLVDCDPQSSATMGVGFSSYRPDRSLYNAMKGHIAMEALILRGKPDLLDVIPSSDELFRAEWEFMARPDKEKILSHLLAGSRKAYEYIIIDTPASLNFFSINGMVAADSLLIPLQCEYYAYRSLLQQLRSAHMIKENYNPGLKIEGILLTMFDMGEKVSQHIAKNARLRLKNLVLKTIIPRSVQLRESSTSGKPLMLTDAASIGARSYLELAREIIEKNLAGSRPNQTLSS